MEKGIAQRLSAFSTLFLLILSPTFHHCIGVSPSPPSSPHPPQHLPDPSGFADRDRWGSSDNANVKPLPIDPDNSSAIFDNNDTELGNMPDADETIGCLEACWNNETCSNTTLSINHACVFYDEESGIQVCDPMCLEMEQICPVLSDYAKEVRDVVKIWLDGVSKVSKNCSLFVKGPLPFPVFPT